MTQKWWKCRRWTFFILSKNIVLVIFFHVSNRFFDFHDVSDSSQDLSRFESIWVDSTSGKSPKIHMEIEKSIRNMRNNIRTIFLDNIKNIHFRHFHHFWVNYYVEINRTPLKEPLPNFENRIADILPTSVHLCSAPGTPCREPSCASRKLCSGTAVLSNANAKKIWTKNIVSKKSYIEKTFFKNIFFEFFYLIC